MKTNTKSSIDEALERDFGPWIRGGENALSYNAILERTDGFGRRTNYNLQIINTLIQNGKKELFERLPQEVLRGMSEGRRRNVEASLVLRGNESPVRQGTGGLPPVAGGGEEIENENPFQRWERQTRSLEAWARNDGCWHDDVKAYLSANYGAEIGHGSESRVYRCGRNHVIKAISYPFNPQEAVDRISITNFIFPFSKLELTGIGRGEDGGLFFLVKQQFFTGEAATKDELRRILNEKDPTAHEAVTKNLKVFKKIGMSEIFENLAYYASDNYIVGDLHEGNVIISENGNLNVIDSNIFLNTPERGCGGKWVIKPVPQDMDAMREINSAMSRILPKSESMDRLLPVLQRIHPSFKKDFDSNGGCIGPVVLPLKDGSTKQYVFQRDPENNSNFLYNTCENIFLLCKYDKRFNKDQAAALASGETVRKNGSDMHFDLHKGRVVEISQKKLKKDIHLNEAPREEKRKTISPGL